MITIPEDCRKLNKGSDENSNVLYIQVLEKIRLWILKGYIKEGEYLPSEREIAALFDVSRMPVTQALKILEFLGVVRFIRGKGFCVKSINLHNIIKCIGFMVMSEENDITDIQEAREGIEVQAASLAAPSAVSATTASSALTVLRAARVWVMPPSAPNARPRSTPSRPCAS